MNIPSPQNMNGGLGGNGFADIIKSQMLTMTMISSMNTLPFVSWKLDLQRVQ